MTFGLSTHWNAYRHKSGETLIEEILTIGVNHVELGYDIYLELVPGIVKMVEEKAVVIDSLHNFCPIPLGAPCGHPELFSLVSTNPQVRRSAIHHTARTIDFASELGAKVVVAHAGNLEMKSYTRKLLRLAIAGKKDTPRFERIKLKMIAARQKVAAKQIKHLYTSLEELLPVLQKTGVRLALENLPSWESVPTEIEMEAIIARFGSDQVCYWHDMGHGQVRQNLGLIHHLHSMSRLLPHTAGTHIHDVRDVGDDHLMPPAGDIDFALFKELGKGNVCRVLEPKPGTSAYDVVAGLGIVKEAWA